MIERPTVGYDSAYETVPCLKSGSVECLVSVYLSRRRIGHRQPTPHSLLNPLHHTSKYVISCAAPLFAVIVLASTDTDTSCLVRRRALHIIAKGRVVLFSPLRVCPTCPALCTAVEAGHTPGAASGTICRLTSHCSSTRHDCHSIAACVTTAGIVTLTTPCL